MRKKVIAANWKMYKTSKETKEFCQKLFLPVSLGLELAEEESQNIGLLCPFKTAYEMAVFKEPAYSVGGKKYVRHGENSSRQGKAHQLHEGKRLAAVGISLF